MDTTIDGILNHRVKIEQPAHGYRVAIDTVFLAAAVPAQAGERVIEFGCGVGGAMLCLMARVPGVSAVGIDIQDELVELCRTNIALNKAAKADVMQGDVTHLGMADYDHVMMNPPYHDETTHDVSDDASKRIANAEKDGDLPLWIASGARALKKTGVLTLIHRGDRLNEILQLAGKHFGSVEVLPMLPKEGAAPKRVIVRMRKKTGGISHCRPIILYREGGGYTDEAESILRHAKVLKFA